MFFSVCGFLGGIPSTLSTEGNLQQQENSINNLSEKTSHIRQSISALFRKKNQYQNILRDLAVKTNNTEQAIETCK